MGIIRLMLRLLEVPGQYSPGTSNNLSISRAQSSTLLTTALPYQFLKFNLVAFCTLSDSISKAVDIVIKIVILEKNLFLKLY